MFSYTKFEQDILSNLNKSSEMLINNLNQISELVFNPSIDLIDFEIFVDPMDFIVNIMMFSMDGEANEVFNEIGQESYFAGSKEILSEIIFYDNIDEDIFDNDELLNKIGEIIDKAIIGWFVSCWKKSTCNIVNLPCYVGFHDDIVSYDLKNNIWIDANDKYSEE